MAYEALDFYDIDSLLTDEERMIRDVVRDWVEERILPNIEDACREGVFPDEWRAEIGEMGILGAPLKGYGCPGLSYTAYGLICQELERGDSGVRSFASVQGSLAMYPIWDFGSEEQKEKYLPGMASGELVGCFGLTEPDYGSNPGDMLTKAEDKGDYFLLNGERSDGLGAFHLVDWPGLGYAKVPARQRVAWSNFLAQYLSERPQLKLLVHLIDGEVGPTDVDRSLMATVGNLTQGGGRYGAGWGYAVALTKLDKDKRDGKPSEKVERLLSEALAENGCEELHAPPVATSARATLGRDAMWRLLRCVMMSDDQT